MKIKAKNNEKEPFLEKGFFLYVGLSLTISTLALLFDKCVKLATGVIH